VRCFIIFSFLIRLHPFLDFPLLGFAEGIVISAPRRVSATPGLRCEKSWRGVACRRQQAEKENAPQSSPTHRAFDQAHESKINSS
jgi:hypothetical protein